MITAEFSLSANLLAEVEAIESPAASADEGSFLDVATRLLERAGGGVSLAEGAKLLGISRQGLHKKVNAASALGIMWGNEIVLPRMQFVTEGGETRLVPGLSRIVQLFEEAKAGGWSALQFLIDPDPNLGEPPGDALEQGRVDAVVDAARAYLGLDEG